MNGKTYLQEIKRELEAGHYQHKKGTSVLNAFGYSRRRQAAIEIINKELKILGLITVPPIDEFMPLDGSHISFTLNTQDEAPLPAEIEQTELDIKEQANDIEMPSFKVAEIEAANKYPCCIKTNDTIKKAYTIMCEKKYSQLVVCDTDKPLATSIKGLISLQSMVDTLMRSNPAQKSVNNCLDKAAPQISINDEVTNAVELLKKHDALIVIGIDKRLCGIITAWDLAGEFANLVGPFKWIGEIESRLRFCVVKHLGIEPIFECLKDIRSESGEKDIERLTLGELVYLFQKPDNWQKMDLPFEHSEFTRIIDSIREIRNRLMHFRDPLNPGEITQLQQWCDLIRKIPCEAKAG